MKLVLLLASAMTAVMMLAWLHPELIEVSDD